MSRIAVIGGTGMNPWPGLIIDARREVDTPFGSPSSLLMFGRVEGTAVVFLVRHGEGHRIPPHRINYRANLTALKKVGVSEVIAIAAVGGIAPWFAPGEVAVPDDLIDYTWGREHTFSDGSRGSELRHVEFGQPYTPSLRQRLLQAAIDAGVTVRDGGVMGITQGPRLETPAEVRRLTRDGCDMIGMTGMPEAALAAELGMTYASLAVSVNWAAGIGSGGIHDEIHRSIDIGMTKVRAILTEVLIAV
ncbi:MAG: S-methyl-5'-thioinosine phosphorylase [Panacagrimonas sp.]